MACVEANGGDETSMNKSYIFVAVITGLAIVAYGAFIFLGAWIDGRRQAVRDKGLHPVTASDGNVEAREHVDEDKERS